jgi:uncharacterized Ntn-hydrolase superfamily protein
MRLGRTAPEALRALVSIDSGAAVRQVAMVDAHGNVSAHTGDHAIHAAGHRIGTHYSVQANLMEKSTVWDAMAHAFETAQGDLADRMLRALEAAEKEGGDIRGRQSAAILIVSGQSSNRPWVDRIFDLRVEDHPEPVEELRRLVRLQRAYLKLNEGDEWISRNDISRAMEAYLEATTIVPDSATNGEAPFWVGITLAGEDRLDEAIIYLRRAYVQDPRWAEIVSRLPASRLLPDDSKLVGKLVEGMKGGKEDD